MIEFAFNELLLVEVQGVIEESVYDFGRVVD